MHTKRCLIGRVRVAKSRHQQRQLTPPMSRSRCFAWSWKALQCAAVICSSSARLTAAGSMYLISSLVHYCVRNERRILVLARHKMTAKRRHL
jgi:hypothetical protein